MTDKTVIAGHFSALAESIERQHSNEAVLEAIAHTQASCKDLAEHAESKEIKRLCGNIQTALSTWKEVWPRLSRQPEFRLAVVREARLWSKRFEVLDP